MDKKDLIATISRATPFDDEHSILKTFEMYVTYDNIKGCTRITIINVDSKHKHIIYIDYIQRDQHSLIKMAESLINTNLLI